VHIVCRQDIHIYCIFFLLLSIKKFQWWRFPHCWHRKATRSQKIRHHECFARHSWGYVSFRSNSEVLLTHVII
jgi:hypothetical protein